MNKLVVIPAKKGGNGFEDMQYKSDITLKTISFPP